MTDDDDVVTLSVTLAFPPWCGFCAGSCGRELGMTIDDRYLPGSELVARIDDDHWICMPCLTDLVRDQDPRVHETACLTPGA